MEKYYLKINHLSFSYGEDPILTDIHFQLEPNSGLILFGNNGSGKSTLLKLILGELQAKKNTVLLFDQDVHTIKSWEDLGYVPQANVSKSIAFPVTVEEILASSQIRTMPFFQLPSLRQYQRSHEQLKKFRLEKYRKYAFHELSGGLQQRVMIARAMLSNPKLLLLDEPTAGVDEKSKIEFLYLLREMQEKEGFSYILVTHDLEKTKEILHKAKSYELRKGELFHV